MQVENMELVEKNYTELDRDLFYKTGYGVREVYFNFDADSGGQFVINEIPFELIKESYAAFKDNVDEFFGCLGERSKQFLVDVDSPDFKAYFNDFMKDKPDFENYNQTTMEGLAKHAKALSKTGYNRSEPER